MATILITSGGTKVAIDEVRHIGNMSSGRFGANLAREALKMGHTVIFLHAKGSHRPDQVTLDLRANTRENRDEGLMKGIGELLADQSYLNAVYTNLIMVEYRDFYDYAEKLEHWSRKSGLDYILLAAAVSDYGMPATGGKISSDKDEIAFTLTKLPKLIAKVKQWAPKATLVGFKLLVDATESEMDAAVQKQFDAAGSDFVVANDLRDIKSGYHRVYVYAKTGLRGNPFVSIDEKPETIVLSVLTGNPKGQIIATRKLEDLA